jgi:hypothetical protein
MQVRSVCSVSCDWPELNYCGLTADWEPRTTTGGGPTMADLINQAHTAIDKLENNAPGTPT